MRYLSVCSGIEAATVAWHPLGWTPAGFSEIEPFPRAVLEQRHGAVAVDDDHRWSEGQNFTPLFGDFTKIEADHVGPVDLLVGGTPCQSFSVAGKRLGLDDPRGNLAIEFLALAQRVRARWPVWENVPGVYSSWSGEPDDDTIGEWVESADFAEFLNLFRECGYRGCWRTIDAQYVRVDGFGNAVPQRRRRVFLVGHSGNDARALPVLFDPESLRGLAAPRREAGQGPAAAPGRDPEGDCGDGGIGSPSGAAATLRPFGADGSGGPAGDECQNLVAAPVCPPLTAGGNSTGGDRQPGTTADQMEALIGVPVAPTISARTRGGGGLGTDAECDGAVFAVPFDTTQITSKTNRSDPKVGDPCHTLQAAAHAPSIAYQATSYADGTFSETDTAATDRFRAAPIAAVAYNITPSNSNKDFNAREASYAQAVTAGDPSISARGGDVVTIPSVDGWAVRKLTPRECERLQGFPDDFTLITVRGKPAADGPRYKAIGNSMAVNVMRWIGMRIDLVERACAAAEAEKTA